MSKISNMWSLMTASWQVLNKDKEMLIFPLISGICCLVVMSSFAIPLYMTGNWHWQPPSGDTISTNQVAIYYTTLFLFYFCNYFVIVFFNSALIACAVIRMSGGDPTVSDGFRAAIARLPLIAGWTLVLATVGLILRIIGGRSEKTRRIVSSLLGMVWSVVSFLVIPILVIEKKSPIAALKESTMLLKKTWGEQLIGNFGFGIVFLLLGIPAFFLIFLGIFAGSSIAIICFCLAAVYLIVSILIQSALQAIFQVAIYLYARDGQAPPGFQSELIAATFVPRR